MQKYFEKNSKQMYAHRFFTSVFIIYYLCLVFRDLLNDDYFSKIDILLIETAEAGINDQIIAMKILKNQYYYYRHFMYCSYDLINDHLLLILKWLLYIKCMADFCI